MLILCGMLTGLTMLTAQSVLRPAGRFFPHEQLLRIPDGFLGILREGRITQFIRYSTDLREQRTIAYEGVNVQDAVLGPAGQSVILLASASDRAAVFSMSRLDTLSLRLIWQSNLPPMRKILSAGRNRTAILGDSAFASISTVDSGHYVRTGEILDGMVFTSDSDRVLLLINNRPNALLLLLDLTTGRTLAQRELGDCSRAFILQCSQDGDRRLAVVTIGTVGTSYILDNKNLRVLRQKKLPGIPIGIVRVRTGKQDDVAAIFSVYPAPSFLMLNSDQTTLDRLDYPLDQSVEAVVSGDGVIAMLGKDSTALYDGSLKLQESFPTPGMGPDVRPVLIDSSQLMMSSAAGTHILLLGRNRYSWMDRNWKWLTAAVAGTVCLLLLLLFMNRYRFRDVVYQTLVRVPGSNGIIIVSASQRVRHINTSARTILDIGPIIPTGRHVTEYLAGDEYSLVVTAVRKLCSAGEAFETRADVVRPDRVSTLLFRGRPMIGRFGLAAGFLLSVEDITRTLERERLVNWASVAHHIAHEMKTPLGTVRLTAETLLSRLMDKGITQEEQRSLDRIITQSERLRSIVEDLMKMARTELLDKSETDLASLLKLLADEFRENLQPTCSLILETRGMNFACTIDAGQITVAVRNLLDNARQAIGTRAGGQICLVAEDPGDDTVLVRVSDNGVGMADETLTRIFQPFYTEREGGSGIGTVIVKRIAEAHHGEVAVQSKLGEGSVFTLRLPRK